MSRWILLLGLLAMPALADEVVVVSTPIPVVQDPVDHYELTDFAIHTWPQHMRVEVSVIAMTAGGGCARDQYRKCQQISTAYTDEVAAIIINQLNTANLTTNSLRKRILNKLIADGVLPSGTVAGTPGVAAPTPGG